MSQCAFVLLRVPWLVRSVNEGPGDGHLRAVCLGLADGVPRANREVERVSVSAAAGAVVRDDGVDRDTVVQVGERDGLSAVRRIVALRLCSSVSQRRSESMSMKVSMTHGELR